MDREFSKNAPYKQKIIFHLVSSDKMSQNKVIGTRGQGVGEGCPRELTTEHLTKASLQLD